jgi:very-short-patch-repair endonuclease/predicted transcriptional regulator of viral defense system
MDPQTLQISLGDVLALAAKQHGVVTRGQLLELGLSPEAIKYRLRRGRLHRVQRGVYAVGRPQLTRHGALIAAVLSCGPEAAVSHEHAAEIYGMRRRRGGAIEVTVPAGAMRQRPGVRVHRAALPPTERTLRHGIPVTAPVRTLVDLAQRLDARALEGAVNEADKLDLVDPERLRAALERMNGRRGVAALRELLDRRTFTLTDSELERRFLPLARRAGLPRPLTQRRVNGFRVDFYWPELKLVVETDGLRYHRTPAQQGKDRRRDQAQSAAGLTPLRFTHHQIAHEAEHVETILVAVVERTALTPAPTASR